MPHVLIMGGGFAGLNAAKKLGNVPGVDVTIIDQCNYHLFQPLLYQVAMAGLSPADIAAPIRSVLSRFKNIQVLEGKVQSVDLEHQLAFADFGALKFDYLLMACGARHSYFGHDDWETYAPGLKNVAQATEIRRRVLQAFEGAERCESPEEQRRLLNFVIVGGGPTGVELAGAIAEMSRFTLAKDFRRIDPTKTHVILLESGSRIMAAFDEKLVERAVQDLERLGVQVRTNSAVTKIDADGVEIGPERIHAATVLWAAGVQASRLGACTGLEVDRNGRVLVEPDLSVKGHPNVFVAGDQACFLHQTGKPLPGTAPVAMQQGRYVARVIRNDLAGKPRVPFHFVDKGQMATIGRSRAIAEIGKVKVSGFTAWLIWLIVHIYYLTGFPNRILVVMQWAWSYLTFRRGARLIVDKEWRLSKEECVQPPQHADV
jgi:NADH dehydrogenase